METALPKDEYLDLNDGRYLRESFTMRQCKSSLYLTTHLEAADTGLPHYHESAHLSFILNGSVIDKRRSIETERVTGDLMFFRAGEVHQSIYCEFPAKNINFELEPSFFTQNAITETDLETAISGNGRAKFTLLRIYREMMINDDLSQASIEMLLLEIGREGRVRPVAIAPAEQEAAQTRQPSRRAPSDPIAERDGLMMPSQISLVNVEHRLHPVGYGLRVRRVTQVGGLMLLPKEIESLASPASAILL